MQIDWTHFTPWESLTGGLVIGLAAALLLLLLGRVLGVSGIVDGVLTKRGAERGWRAAFLLGLFATPTFLSLFLSPAAPVVEGPWTRYAVAGLLVGFGTRLGAGCTSGHGVCGLSRLSPRSLVATLSFIFGGIVTVYVFRHLAA